ncbi:methyltransferase [Lysobacter humi (ex Lee et al. 2017)]
MHDDPALDALFLPFDDGTLAPPRAAAFLGARDGAAPRRWLGDDAALEQGFRPLADALERTGRWTVRPELEGGAFDTVLVLPPRQREEARARLARAVSLLAPGGRVVVAAPNNAGARSLQDDLAALAGPVGVLSKHKCRVVWTAPLDGPADAALQADWAGLDAPRRIADDAWWSRPGLFAWDRVDPASALLVRHLPSGLRGDAADLGAGWGYLSATLLATSPGLTRLDAFEAQHAALEPLGRNLAACAGTVPATAHWHDVTVGLSGRFDVIVSNPPFHADDRRDRPELGQRFITAAAAALRPGGRFWMVANRHLPYEATLRSAFAQVRPLADERGFKVYEAVR